MDRRRLEAVEGGQLSARIGRITYDGSCLNFVVRYEAGKTGCRKLPRGKDASRAKGRNVSAFFKFTLRKNQQQRPPLGQPRKGNFKTKKLYLHGIHVEKARSFFFAYSWGGFTPFFYQAQFLNFPTFCFKIILWIFFRVNCYYNFVNLFCLTLDNTIKNFIVKFVLLYSFMSV